MHAIVYLAKAVAIATVIRLPFCHWVCFPFCKWSFILRKPLRSQRTFFGRYVIQYLPVVHVIVYFVQILALTAIIRMPVCKSVYWCDFFRLSTCQSVPLPWCKSLFMFRKAMRTPRFFVCGFAIQHFCLDASDGLFCANHGNRQNYLFVDLPSSLSCVMLVVVLFALAIAITMVIRVSSCRWVFLPWCSHCICHDHLSVVLPC